MKPRITINRRNIKKKRSYSKQAIIAFMIIRIWVNHKNIRCLDSIRILFEQSY
jgi:hypothetical protein